jgi:hypothetical protein
MVVTLYDLVVRRTTLSVMGRLTLRDLGTACSLAAIALG